MTNLVVVVNGFEATRNEEAVRSTLDPVTDAPAAEAPSEPDYNEHLVYPEPVQGLNRHEMLGHTTPSEQYAPFWTPKASEDFESRINRQVSSSGTAAARENAGMQGHGTMQRTETVEPQLNEETALGADYFAAHPVNVQGTSGDYMSDQVGDPQLRALADSFANAQARQAAQSGMYGAWLGQGG
jgi:hypothetical protein